jgi:PKHD-type hydroxylase
MLLSIPNVLTPQQVADCRRDIDAAEWVDGRVTAGHQSAQAKNNAQIAWDNPVGVHWGNNIAAVLKRNPLFVAAALPLKIFPPLFNRYAGGQSFGTHVDNGMRLLRDSGGHVRTDISATLFLSAPTDYDGGELVVEDTYGVHQVKLPAGHMVIYPGGSLHHVNPVTRGARIAAFFWIQSMVRDDGERTLLFDLDNAILGLKDVTPEKAEKIAIKLTGIYHNLLRRWGDS